MSTRRIIIAIVLALLAFLGIYTWNQRTGQWDWLAANTGLEVAGGVLRAVHGVGDSIGAVWKRYLALIDVQEENDRLRDEVARLHQELIASRESQAELERLRGLLRLEVPQGWSVVGARVLASRIGPNASLETGQAISWKCALSSRTRRWRRANFCSLPVWTPRIPKVYP